MVSKMRGMPKRLSRYALALAIGVACAIIAQFAGMPLPWMLGPMIGTMAASVFGLPVSGPNVLRPIVVPVLGLMLGSGFRPEMLDHVGLWVVSLSFVPVFVLVAGGLAYLYYRYIAGFDHVTSFFAGMPGGLNEMILMGHEKGGNDKQVALAHACRIFIVVTFIVFLFKFALGVNLTGSARTYIGILDLSLADAAWLVGCGIVGVFAGKWLKLPASGLVGPMILSSIIHVTAIVQTPPPTTILLFAQLILGTALGCRFSGVPPREIGINLLYGAGATVITLIVSLAIAGIVFVLAGTSLDQGFLAFSPGGITETSLLALAMGQDAIYVSTNHVARLAVVVAIAPIIFRLVGTRTREPTDNLK